MAIELCSSDESCRITSPRISFSHDISQTDSVPIEQYIRSTSPSSSIDFDFCVFRESFDLESSSADELFFDGKILPIEIKRRLSVSSVPLKKTEQEHQQQQPLPPPKQSKTEHHQQQKIGSGKSSNTSHATENKTFGSSKTSNSEDATETTDEKQSNSKSFWRFKRSSSLNCGNGYARSLCPLPLLSRSNSTGSAPNVKKQQHSSRPFSKSMSSNSNGHYQKPPLKKGHGNYYPYSNNNGVRINSVLNVPSASLFGLSSFFSNGKEKNKKK